ncbi:hypothetical protein QJS10_CPA09g01972 [Acorus calamus]|uniref:RING-type domain-containing protein n=1 Tax=Acorus calamus TaxID=4465 RepID=A0AAV9E7X2_ACOCL|nr:hypothetical protein QJS10_CPA09g01972 [Acorus calamus]
MGEAEKHSRFIKPFIFHLRKMELELKCPVCLKLLSQSKQLPCDHVLCSHCISNMKNDLRCPLCKMSHTHQDLRPIPHLESIVSIFKNMSATFHLSDMQWSSNRLMSSNTTDVISQLDLMKNINGEKYRQIINPLIFHLRKLELELKCSVCLNLLSQPTSLPCNHAFCSHCILNVENDMRCLLCKMSHTHQDLRLMSLLQNIVSIFKNMSATFHVSDMQWISNRPTNSNTGDVTSQMDLMNNINGEKSGGTQKSLFPDNEPVQAPVQPTEEVNTSLFPDNEPVLDMQWISNGRTNSNAGDVTSQMDLMDNINGEKSGGTQKSLFPDNEPVQAPVQPIEEVNMSLFPDNEPVPDMQWISNRPTNSNTGDVTSQMDLMDNINGEKSGSTQKSLFPDNEPVQAPVQPTEEVNTSWLPDNEPVLAPVQPTEEVNTLEGHEKTNEQDSESHGLNLEAQSVDDNNDWDSGFDIIPFEQNVEGSPNIDTTESFTTSLVFDSRKELIEWVKKVGRSVGVVVVIGRSDASDPRRAARIILICERGGKHEVRKRKSDKPRRRSSTKKCGCPFKLHAMNVAEKWRLKVMCGLHNHALITNSEGHKCPGKSFVGKLLDEEYDMVQSMLASGMRPRDILSHLKARDPTNASSIRTIYNARRKMRVMETSGRTDMENES